MKELRLILALTLFSIIKLEAQHDIVVPNEFNGKTLQVFCSWAKTSHGLILISNQIFDNRKLRVKGDSTLLAEALNTDDTVAPAYVNWDDRGYIFITTNEINEKLDSSLFKGESESINDQNEKGNDYLKTGRSLGLMTIVIGSEKAGAYASSATITGRILRQEDSKPIVGATVLIKDLGEGTVSDAQGRYQISLKKGRYTVSIKSIEYEEATYELTVLSSDKVDFKLKNKVFGLNEVVVSAEANAIVQRTTMGVEKMSATTMKKLPRVMGEPDIVKSALLLPGIQSVGEGTGGLNVRGAPADQNIFYLDGIAVYNTNHLMGFFSAFTPGALSDFTLYKGSIPANYGGRLSSVFDISTKEPNTQKFGLRGGISPITMDIQAESPITDKISGLVGLRGTYSSWVLNLIDVPQLHGSDGSFRDGIVKLNHRLTDKSSYSFTQYSSHDKINLNGTDAFEYRNQCQGISWKEQIRFKHQLSLGFNSSRYDYKETNEQFEFSSYNLSYSIAQIEGKANLSLHPNEHHNLNIGLKSVNYELDLGNISPFGGKSVLSDIDFGKEHGLESAAYVDEEWIVGPRLTLRGGVRLNAFQYLGPKEVYTYASQQQRSLNSVIDTVQYGKNRIIANYINPDVRLAIKYSITEFLAVKGSINSVHQYINILTNTVAIAPSAKWKLADPNIKPMEGWQYSTGLFRNYKQKYESSVEVYYKKVGNILDYRDGADLLFNTHPEIEILQGELNAYGVELMLKKIKGKYTGWINYTYARSFMTVPGINQDKTYPSNFDKPHSLNLSMNYRHSTRVNVSANVVYSTGRPVTYPSASFFYNESPLTYYSTRNEFRIPDYFRCDLSLNLEGNLKSKKLFHGSWNFSVYNLFGRKNAYTVYALQQNGAINGYKLSIFGSTIASVAYQIKLGCYEH